jgi:ribosomal protein L40E
VARVGLGDAKAIISHLSGEGGVCHRCGTRLNEAGEEQNCPKCRSLNLLW